MFFRFKVETGSGKTSLYRSKDFFNLMGVEAIDPHASRKLDPKLRSHPLSGRNKSNNNNKNQPSDSAPSGGLSAEDARLIKWVKDQHSRRGGFIRIFPREETWSAYGALLEFKTHTNELLAARLFPDTYRSGSAIIRSRAMEDKMATSGAKGRFNQYERRLLAFDSSERKKERRRIRRTRKLKKKKQVEVTSDLDDDPEEAEEEETQSPSAQKAEEKSEVKVKKSSSEIILRENKTPPTYIENSTIYQSIRSSKMTRTGEQNGKPGQEIGQGDHPQKDNSKTVNNDSMLKTATKQPEPEPKLDITAEEANQTIANEPAPPSVPTTKTTGSESETGSTQPEIEEVIPNFKLKEIVTSIKRRARDLCQIEAREAFATYLLRVQQRFMIEATGSTKSTTDLGRKYANEKSRDDQIELVCRFLTRASGNLENPLDLNLPDPETTPITERKKIIGNLLIEFTQRYNKETQALINSGQKISSGIGTVSKNPKL